MWLWPAMSEVGAAARPHGRTRLYAAAVNVNTQSTFLGIRVEACVSFIS